MLDSRLSRGRQVVGRRECRCGRQEFDGRVYGRVVRSALTPAPPQGLPARLACLDRPSVLHTRNLRIEVPSLSAALAFAAVAFLMALSPGPNLVYLASRSICQGRAAGFASLAGVCTAMLLYMLATTAGLSALFVAIPIAYDLVRWAGAAYMLWLSINTLTTQSSPIATSALQRESPSQLYRRGFLTCLLNPKVVVTYSALLPQFLVPDAEHVFLQTVVLGLVQLGAAAAAHTLVILCAAAAASALAKHRAFAGVQRYLLSAVLAALALRLVADRRSPI
jgi:threonine/homoserine/homoserine lactone efflux protein